MHTLVYIKYITNRDLLYTIGKYTQHLVVTFNEKDDEKKYIYILSVLYMYVCMCITGSHCCTSETGHCKSAISIK